MAAYTALTLSSDTEITDAQPGKYRVAKDIHHMLIPVEGIPVSHSHAEHIYALMEVIIPERSMITIDDNGRISTDTIMVTGFKSADHVMLFDCRYKFYIVGEPKTSSNRKCVPYTYHDTTGTGKYRLYRFVNEAIDAIEEMQRNDVGCHDQSKLEEVD